MVFLPGKPCGYTRGNIEKPLWIGLKENVADIVDFGTRRSGRKVVDSYRG